MPILKLTETPSRKGFSYVRVNIKNDGGFRNILIFFTNDRANILKLIKKYITSVRPVTESYLDDYTGESQFSYAISQLDEEMIKLLHRKQKDYEFLRSLIDLDSREKVVLELELSHIADEILR